MTMATTQTGESLEWLNRYKIKKSLYRVPSRVVIPVPHAPERFEGEHVRTLYRKGAARNLLRTV
jgi:hypothetical protein